MPGLNLMRLDRHAAYQLNAMMLGQIQNISQNQGLPQMQLRSVGTNKLNSMNMSMLSRVVNSSPGCSSCGK